MIWSALMILGIVVVGAAPWGVREEATFVLPFLTLLAIFIYAVPRETSIPAWLAFVAGLATDVLTAGPLGYWGALFTLCFALARLMARQAPARSLAMLWMQYFLVSTVVAGAGWALASLYYLRPIDQGPIIWGALVSMFVCPLVLWSGRGRPTISVPG